MIQSVVVPSSSKKLLFLVNKHALVFLRILSTPNQIVNTWYDGISLVDVSQISKVEFATIFQKKIHSKQESVFFSPAFCVFFKYK